MSNDIIEKLAEAGHLSDDQIERINRRVADFIKAAEKDPELYAEAQEKVGSFFDTLATGAKGFGKAVGQQTAAAAAGALALGVVGGTSALAGEAYRSMKESREKAKAYKDMMADAGDRLEGIPPKQIQQSFNTLHATNPDYAKDPVVAAEFIRETSRSEAYPFQLLKMMGDSRRDRPGFEFGAYKGIMSTPKPTDMFGGESPDAQADRELALRQARKERKLPVK